MKTLIRIASLLVAWPALAATSEARSVPEGASVLEMLQYSVRGSGWALSLPEVKSEVVVFGKHLRKFNTYRYTDFRRQPR